MSWSGSEAPLIEGHITFLRSLKDELHGIEYIEHRAYLDERIQWLQKDKDNILLREFLEDKW